MVLQCVGPAFLLSQVVKKSRFISRHLSGMLIVQWVQCLIACTDMHWTWGRTMNASWSVSITSTRNSRPFCISSTCVNSALPSPFTLWLISSVGNPSQAWALSWNSWNFEICPEIGVRSWNLYIYPEIFTRFHIFLKTHLFYLWVSITGHKESSVVPDFSIKMACRGHSRSIILRSVSTVLDEWLCREVNHLSM